MIGIFKGLYTTGKHFFRKAVTVQYPLERLVLSDRYRGLLRLHGMVGERGDVPECDFMPPCTTNCPANVDARGQNTLIAEGKPEEAHILVRKSNTMPGVLGRVCHHPCESVCKRGHYDNSISIKNLHRTISDAYFKSGLREENVEKSSKGKSVAIVGGGPAGLTAAFDLVKLGYDITIYEKNHVAGGALVSGIPAYRLPRNILQREIDDLVRMGVKIKTGVEAGKDFSINSLFDEDYSSILLAVGLRLSRSIPIPGVDLEGVMLALPFLADVNFERPVKPVKRLVVIGGGNVAVDVARCAKRLGFKEVHMACLESREEMPAHDWEIREMEAEGIEVNNCLGPKEIIGKNGKVSGFKFIECCSVFDEEGRFNPCFDESVETIIECDAVVIAIGQMSQLDFLKDTGININERGQLVVDNETKQTTRAGVFACGEVITGPGSAIGSIANAHDAAISIDNYLSGIDLNYRPKKLEAKDWPDSVPGMRLNGYEEFRGGKINIGSVKFPTKRIHERIGNFIPMFSTLRTKMPMAGMEEAIKDFREIELGFSNDKALAEAWRCLRCESRKCVLCGVCATVCPVDAISIEIEQSQNARKAKKYEINTGICIYCGICSENCPTQTLFHSQFYELAVDNRDKMVYSKDRLLVKDEEREGKKS